MVGNSFYQWFFGSCQKCSSDTFGLAFLGVTCAGEFTASEATPLLCAAFYKMLGIRQEKEPSRPGTVLMENEPGFL